jgi:hypothetical protein
LTCSACQGGVCNGCKKGYYLSGNSCAACAEGCSSCSTLVWCDSCNTGYSLSNGKCTKGKI